MFMARVKGNVVTSHKVEKMKGRKMLIVEPVRVSPDNSEIIGTGRSFIAVDTLGAGTGELVVITQGSSSRMTSGTSDAPVDCVIIGIIDSVTVLGDQLYENDK
jgi:microcompartment protein CcmK/EutM